MSDTRMKCIGGEVDLTTWGIAGIIGERVGENAMREVSDAIKEEFIKTPPSMFLPWMWGPDSDGLKGEGVDDPITMYVCVPLGAYSDDEGVTFSISLEALIDDYIDGESNGPECVKMYEAESIKKAQAVIRRLREVADKLEKACANEAEQQEFFRKYGDLK